MLKVFACLLLVAMGGGFGFFLSRRYLARVRQLEKCDAFLSRLETYLGMEKLTTRELFERLSESDSIAELTFLGRTARGLSQDVNFPAVWRQSLLESRAELNLNAEDYRPLAALTDLIGAYDAPAQQNGIEVSRALLRERLADAQEKYRQNGKLSQSLGLLGGVAAAILVL